MYWMQASQRAECNHALEYAVARANELNQPVVALFALMEDYPEANERHYAFMLEGLAETQSRLSERGVQLVVRRGPPADTALEAAVEASLVVVDRGYLRHQRAWRRQLALKAPARTGRAAYLEELLVRRELSMNFVFHNERYDSYPCLPMWARTTLKDRSGDRRPYLYSRQELEACGTHDPYWNAAMREMVVTGKMHNYMRMYWGKKIIEWAPSPQAAFRVMLELNNKYFLDARDPVSYANVAWCFGLHDRPWGRRPIFGTVRYMGAAGLERKFHVDEYVRRTASLSEA